MRLTVPYCVLAHREDGDYRLIDQTEIEITEVSGTDAPVVAQYDDLTAISQMTRTIRVHQGRFYFPALGANGAAPLDIYAIQRNPEGAPRPADLLQYIEVNGGHGEKIGRALREDLALWYRGQPPRWFGDALTFGPYTPMSDERRQNLLSASRGLLLVDGYLHYEANEPFIAVTSTGQTLVRSDFDMRVHARRLGGDIARFSLVDAEKAEAFANREFPNRTLPDKRYDRMSVFDGDAFPFDSFADIALTAGLQLVHDSRNQIHQMSASQVECWLDLRDETEAARGENGDSEKLVDLIDDFLRRDMPDADRMAKRELEWLDWMTDETERQHRSSVPGPIP